MKPRTNLTIAVIAAGLLAVVAFRGFTRPAPRLASKPAPEACSPEAIRQVTDALERSLRSAQCAQQARAATHQDAAPASH